eukprot:4477752-Prymnesium_polylepis.1
MANSSAGSWVGSAQPARVERAQSQCLDCLLSIAVAKNWAAAMGLFNAVSVLAEEEGHHPDLHLTSWRNVRIELSTHAIGGLSLPDLVLAAKIDAIPVECSPKWLRELEAAEKAAEPPPAASL